MTAALQELLTISPRPAVRTRRRKSRRPRDVQQGKVYKAEQAAWGIRHGDWVETYDDFQALKHYTREETLAWYVNITGARWFRSRFGSVRPIIKFSRGSGGSTSHWGDVITIGDEGRTELLFIHELAHAIVGCKIQTMQQPCLGHGVEFAAVLLTLVDNHLGKEMGRKYRAAFAEHRVKYRAGMARVPKPGTFPVATKAQKKAVLNREKTKPLSVQEKKQAAALIRRAVAQGVFGPSGRKPRTHALATARELEA